jgi:hypothetical protein
MDILTCFKMANCKPCATPFPSGLNLTKTCQTPKVNATLYRQLVGSLIYLTHSRPHISFVVSVVSQFMQDPREIHSKSIKLILFYLKGTTHFGIKYFRSSDFLVGFTESD